MNDKMVQKCVQEIGSLRMELLYRDTVIDELQTKIKELEEQLERQQEQQV